MIHEPPSEWAERLRTAPHESGRVVARRGLATAIRTLVHGILTARGVPADVADDDANLLSYALGLRIESGTIAAGREDAYVRQCAKNRAVDYYRESSGVHLVYALREEAEAVADDRDPERLLEEHEEAALVARRVEHLRALIATAPEAHRAVLYEVHVKGTLIEDLARQELEARIARGAELARDPAASKRARAAIDQRLCRAREWIRARLELPSRRWVL